MPVDFIDVVDAADIRVGHLARHAHFGVQLCQAGRILIDARREKLQRHRLPELQIVGAKHFSHAAAAETADDSIPGAENVARLKSSVVDSAGGGEPSAAGGTAALASATW